MKMTKAQAKKRLLEAERKFAQVYIRSNVVSGIVKTADMEAIEKIVARCIGRIK